MKATTPLTTEEKQVVVTTYESGEGIVSLGRRFRVRISTIRGVLNSANVTLRSWSDARFLSRISTGEIVRLYQTPLSVDVVAERLGINPKTVHRRLVKAGIIPRGYETGQVTRRTSPEHKKKLVNAAAKARREKDPEATKAATKAASAKWREKNKTKIAELAKGPAHKASASRWSKSFGGIRAAHERKAKGQFPLASQDTIKVLACVNVIEVLVRRMAGMPFRRRFSLQHLTGGN